MNDDDNPSLLWPALGASSVLLLVLLVRRGRSAGPALPGSGPPSGPPAVDLDQIAREQERQRQVNRDRGTAAENEWKNKPLGYEAEAKALASSSPLVKQALDAIFAHPNLGVFVGRQLIQHLVTSNPSPGYVGRVSAAFNAGRFQSQGVSFGDGARGDMKATLAAILLDSEARDASAATASSYGKLREPVLMMTAAIRALDGVTDGDRLGLWAWGAGMSQTPFNAPSVFNFYPPDFPLTGTNLVGPQFAIMTTNTTLARINFANDLVYWWYNKGQGLAPNPTIPGATGTRVSYARWEPLLVDATTDSIKVVDRLALLLTANRLDAAQRQAIVTAMAEYGPRDTWLTDANNQSSWQRERVKTAAYLILASPHHQVQR